MSGTESDYIINGNCIRRPELVALLHCCRNTAASSGVPAIYCLHHCSSAFYADTWL